MQILEAEDAIYRMMLVELLHKVEGKESTQALAKRAVFDVDERVRARAVEHLRSRPLEESRPAILAGFRHLWQPASRNAAAALKTLRDTDALAGLVGMVDEPDPSGAFISLETGNKPVVRELVRFNHNRSCVICHAGFDDRGGKLNAIRNAFVFQTPSKNGPLPPFPSMEYYREGDSLVRLDTTYLRQDFSVKMPCQDPNPKWCEPQRYDFITRLRPASMQEAAAMLQPKASYPQREMVLDVLRYLTGKDGGDSSADWEQMVKSMKR